VEGIGNQNRSNPMKKHSGLVNIEGYAPLIGAQNANGNCI
jgi:hypothetical protein